MKLKNVCVTVAALVLAVSMMPAAALLLLLLLPLRLLLLPLSLRLLPPPLSLRRTALPPRLQARLPLLRFPARPHLLRLLPPRSLLPLLPELQRIKNEPQPFPDGWAAAHFILHESPAWGEDVQQDAGLGADAAVLHAVLLQDGVPCPHRAGHAVHREIERTRHHIGDLGVGVVMQSPTAPFRSGSPHTSGRRCRPAPGG